MAVFSRPGSDVKEHGFSRAVGLLQRRGDLQAKETGRSSLLKIRTHPSAAKAATIPGRLAARINPCPFKTMPEASFSIASLGSCRRFRILVFFLLILIPAAAQQPVNPNQVSTAIPGLPSAAAPIAIVPVEASTTVTGALSISAGKAVIATTGSITSAAKATEVVLPHRGILRVCASTTVNLAADNSVPAGETPGLMMSLDHGAIETSFATGQNADVVLTPDFRILIGAPGSSDLKVRLGEHGDTCIDNPGAHAPYVVVSSVFDGGAYRVQPGQRVMLQHGSLSEVVDNEKEPCGCPPEAKPGTNDFPLAQSAGIGPQAPPITTLPPASASKPAEQTIIDQPLVYQAQPATPDQPVAAPAADTAQQASTPPAAPVKPAPQKKPGFFRSIGQFFRKIFGAE
jgi:hypothetical protein